MKKVLSFVFSLMLAINCLADDFNILPFTGLKYYERGLFAEKLEVELDEQTWTSNKFGGESQFKLRAKKIQGFTADADGNFHPNMKLLVLSLSGDTVGFAPEFMGENNIILADGDSDLAFTLGFNEGTEYGFYTFIMTFFDELSDKELMTELFVEFTNENIPYNFTNNLYSHRSNTRYLLQSPESAVGDFIPSRAESENGYEYRFVISGYDLRPSAMMVQPNYLIDIYDNQGVLIDKKSYIEKVVYTKGEDETSGVDIVITFKDLKTDPSYTTRFRWQSKSGKFILDFVNQFKDL